MIFTHPDNVCMTYWVHFKLSIHLSFLFFKGSVGALIHAVYPDILLTCSTDINNQIHSILTENGCRKEKQV